MKKRADQFSAVEAETSLLDLTEHSQKYDAFNVRSMMEKGSIEFRGHHGTCSEEEILAWVRIILSLFRSAKVYSAHGLVARLLAEKAPFLKYVNEWCPYLEARINEDAERAVRQSILNIVTSTTNLLRA